MVEIEAKFAIPDGALLKRLCQVEDLAGYTVAAGQVSRVRDTFLDTADGAIRRGGYYLRDRRVQGQPGVRYTLKALGAAQGATYHRQELEIVLPEEQPPPRWPAGPLRERVQELAGEWPLRPLLILAQTRTTRLVRQGGRTVAELGLDKVQISADEHERIDLDLEVELLAEGREEDLARIVAALQEEWGLRPQPQSKFERALAFAEEARAGQGLLAPQEQALCRELARRPDLHGRRARALLALDQGARQAEAAGIAGMSVRRVRHWLASFRRLRLGIFPARVMPPVPAHAPQPGAAPARKPSPPRAPESGREPFSPAESGAEAPAPAGPPAPHAAGPGILPGDTMAEAARKVLLCHFRRMLDHEPGVRLGQNIEEVHDMRVATRRMRAALRLFGDYLDPEALRPLSKALRSAGRALGVVRDLEVFYEKVSRYLAQLPPGQPGGLEVLLAAWQERYRTAREELLAFLDGERYTCLKEFSAFLQTPGAGARPALSSQGEPRPTLLRHVVPAALYQSLAAVRAYEEWLAGADVPLQRYHRLRIASKGLRYGLEFFREVLGPQSNILIERVRALQDHLGELQDAVVACNLLRDFLTWGTWVQAPPRRHPSPSEPVIAPGVASYLAFRQAEIQRLLAAFPSVWEPVRSPEFGQLLATALVTLC